MYAMNFHKEQLEDDANVRAHLYTLMHTSFHPNIEPHSPIHRRNKKFVNT